ncbi:neprosin family prolyl endopeptidase [Streptomyces sp. NPDC052000]|uniref:neprosin family prolyl endopeptidase n=1 Tax=Streptomyces sp. NPDC052000 TaxID=3155676 RepID=UPI00344B255A
MPSWKSRTGRRIRIAAAVLSAAAAGAVMLPTTSAHAATCWFGSCYSYVTGRQYAAATGASVSMYQAAPGGVSPTGHSLQELALQSSNDTTTANTIEVGWTVDPGVNGDYQPHLFVFHWVNGQGTCYNGCGFVQVSSTVRAGMALATGATGSFSLMNYQGNWWAYYNNVPFGYFPGTLWAGAFTTAYSTSAFGEVARDSQAGCTQMGDGAYGTSAGSSLISGFQLYGSSSAPNFTVTDSDPSSYNYGSATATSFHLGGPGAC